MTAVGPYRVVGALGEGGVGRVYQAVSPKGERVAIKVLAEKESIADPLLRARFEREMRALEKISDAAVVPFLDSGSDAALGPYLVMGLVEGKTLGELGRGKKLCPEAVLLLVHALAGGVLAIHRAGLVHRDLKPDNVIVTPQGKVVIVDFGLAISGESSRHTAIGTVAGSVPYMSPEQIEGKDLTTATDVWSLGVIAHELLAGKRPFQRSSQSEEVAAILAGSHPKTATVDRRVAPEIAALVDQCLAPNASDRPAAETLRGRIELALDWVTLGDIPKELAAIADDPEGYGERVADRRVTTLKGRAKDALAKGQRMAAMALIDRALAYREGDAELAALVNEAESAKAPPSSRAAPAPGARSRILRIAAIPVMLVLAAGGGALGYRAFNGPSAALPSALPSARPEPPVASAIASASASASALAVAPTGPLPFPDFVPIDPASLANDAKPEPLKDIAKPGEALVPARLLGSAGPAGALASIEKQLRDKPGDVDLSVGRALALLGNNRTKEGLDELARLEKEHPEASIVWSSKGYVAMRQGALDDADTFLSKAIAIDPKEVTPLRNRGILRAHAGRMRDGYVDLVAALMLAADDVEALKDLARVYDRAGHRADAVPIIKRLLRVRPNDAEMWVDLSIAQKDLDESQKSVEKALAIDPKFVRAHVRLCAVLSEKESPEAIGVCTHAVELAPNDGGAYNNRAMAYYKAGDDKAALRDLDKALVLEPKSTSYWTNRYLVRMHAGQSGAARADLAKACDLGSEAACDELKK